MTLNIFYEEPDPDRWLPFDRYPRRVIRRLVRGPPRPGGYARVFLNLCAGLDLIDMPYRVNDYAYCVANPSALACIIGKPQVLSKVAWKNPIMFGAAGYSHPIDDPHLFDRHEITRVLVPGEWMAQMCRPHWGDRVSAWPVGIDTDSWRPSAQAKTTDILLYDKVRWDRETYEAALIEPIRRSLAARGLSITELRYGDYEEQEFRSALATCRAMVFLCEHETQGIAYQEALSCGVPIIAWDRGGPWRDPAYFPQRVCFAPVSSVPYWDERCGDRFIDADDFDSRIDGFWDAVSGARFDPRSYVLDHLTLRDCARRYVEFTRTAA